VFAQVVVVDDDGVERALLEEIARRMVARKCELVEALRGSAGVHAGMQTDNPAAAVEAAAKRLYSQGLITYVTPVSEDCYAITQKGLQGLQGLRAGESRLSESRS
jgi:hypothetical protein